MCSTYNPLWVLLAQRSAHGEGVSPDKGPHGGRACVSKILSFLALGKNKSVVEPRFLPPVPTEALGSHTVDSAPDKPLGSAWGFQDPREPAVFGCIERTPVCLRVFPQQK